MSKKYIALFSFTFFILLGIYLSGSFIKGQIINIDAIKLDYKSVDNIITCSGKIQAANGTNVFVNSASIVRNINVKVGDIVESGDVLMSVVRSDIQTSVLPSLPSDSKSSLFGMSDIPDLSSSLSPKAIETYKQIFDQATEQSPSLMSKSDEVNNLKAENVYSPLSGIVTAINVEEGALAELTKPVAVISENNDLEICLSVNESQISDIKEGQSATITGTGFKGSEYSGIVSSISEVAKQSLSTAGQETVVDVLVRINSNECEDLKTGFTAKCKITTSTDENVLVVPYESINADIDGREYVYKCVDNRAIKTYVKTGKEFSEGFQVLEGIAVNDVIALNVNNLNDGSRVVANNIKKTG